MPKAILWQKSRTASLLKNEEKISGQALNNSEKKYNIGLYTGLTINFIAVCVYISFYGKACMTR